MRDLVNIRFAFYGIIAVLASALILSCSDDDEPCTEITWYQDADGDGLGNPDISFEDCDQPTGYVNNSDDPDDTDDGTGPTYLITSDLFPNPSFKSLEITTCTLEDNSQVDCYSIIFSSDGVDGDVGPYCPETINDVGGLAIYDGETNPGLNVIAAGLLNAIEADGYDIIDEDGNVNVVTNLMGGGSMDVSNCLALEYDPNLEYEFLIPVEPKLANQVDQITEVENLGLSLDGVPLTGDPPSAINGPMMGGPGGSSDQIAFPSLDPCGGHPDPAGYYHLHFIPEVMDQVLEAQGIDEVSCTLIAQTTINKLIGFAKDGFPIYAYPEMPTDLDECQGRTAATDEFPDGIYHYVASTTEAPNMPPCLKGVAARNSFSYQ